MSSTRRFAHWVAWNIDGGNLNKLSRAKLKFVKDRRSRQILNPSVSQVSFRKWTISTSRVNRGWGRLEDALYEDVEVDGLRVWVMAAPVFRDDDMVYWGVALPREFWKVLAYSRNNELAVRAFLLAQDLDPVHAIAALDEFRVYQVELAELEERTGLVFPPVMHAAGVPAAALTGGTGRTPLAKAADIRW